MANILDRFNISVVGSENKISDYTSVIDPSGDFKQVSNLEAILLSWNNILLTATRTYTYDPEYGSDLYKLVFEPADNYTAEKIKEEVITKLQRYDDRARILKVDVSFLNNRKGFAISIDVDFEGETSQLSVVVDESLYFRFMEASE